MSEHRLYKLAACVVLDQMRGKRVAQSMRIS